MSRIDAAGSVPAPLAPASVSLDKGAPRLAVAVAIAEAARTLLASCPPAQPHVRMGTERANHFPSTCPSEKP